MAVRPSEKSVGVTHGDMRKRISSAFPGVSISPSSPWWNSLAEARREVAGDPSPVGCG